MKGTKFVVLNKNGNVTNKKFAFEGNLEDLLIKVTRMKMPCKPIKLYSYIFNSFRIDIWGFIDGKAGQENTHDLPPNAKCYHTEYMKSDSDLLFGDLFALKYKDFLPVSSWIRTNGWTTSGVSFISSLDRFTGLAGALIVS